VSPPDSVDAWAAVLTRLCADRQLSRRLAEGIPPIRSATDVAREMASLYAGLLSAQTPATARVAEPAGVA